MRSCARSYAPGIGSCRIAWIPASATTWAMPAPIVPAPRIPIRSNEPRTAGSASKEARLPLLAEGGDALRVILGAAGELLQRRLHGEALGEQRVLGVVDGSLGKRDGPRRSSGQPGCGGVSDCRQLSAGASSATRPAACASAAESGSPLKISRAARCRPRARTRVRVEPESGTSPIRTKAWMKRASSAA